MLAEKCLLEILKRTGLIVVVFVTNAFVKVCFSGQWCGSVGRAVASNTRDLWFKSSHRQTFIKHLFTVNCVEKTKIKIKRPWMAHFLKKCFSPTFCHRFKPFWGQSRHHIFPQKKWSYVRFHPMILLRLRTKKNRQRSAILIYDSRIKLQCHVKTSVV